MRHSGDVKDFARTQSKILHCILAQKEANQISLPLLTPPPPPHHPLLTHTHTHTVFAWEAYEHGTDIHPLADPTKLEMMHKEFKVKKDDFKSEQQQSVLEKYGGEEHLDAPPMELLLAQTEHYVEYSRLGNVTKGQERAVAKSKYEEDVYVNNHTVSLLSK